MISQFAEYMIEVSRLSHASGYRDEAGDWQLGQQSVTTIQMLDPLPIAGKQVKQLPQGTDITLYKWSVVTSDTHLHVAGSDDSTVSDSIEIGDATYRVHKLIDWSSYGGFIEVYLRLVDR